MTKHAAYSTGFPPGDDTFAGALMMQIAIGQGRAELEGFVEDTTVHEDMADLYDEPPLTPQEGSALLGELLTRYGRAVPRPSRDAERLAATWAALAVDGVVASIGVAFDAAEAAQAGHRAAVAAGARGYLYAHTQDLERVVATGALYVGFSSIEAEPGRDQVLGHEIVEALRRAGLPVQWSGSARDRILVAPVLWEVPSPAEAAGR